jgi:hypothetical protein
MIVLERRLDVVEEVIDRGDVANAFELIKDAKYCRPILSKSELLGRYF